MVAGFAGPASSKGSNELVHLRVILLRKSRQDLAFLQF